MRLPLPGGTQGQHRSRHHGSSVEFADYRAYAPGDPIHRIDWSVYARSDRYLVRRFEDETRLRVHILIDTSESMSFKTSGPCSKLEHASYLAAGLMYILVKQGDTVGLNGCAGSSGSPPRAAGRSTASCMNSPIPIVRAGWWW